MQCRIEFYVVVGTTLCSSFDRAIESPILLHTIVNISKKIVFCIAQRILLVKLQKLSLLNKHCKKDGQE